MHPGGACERNRSFNLAKVLPLGARSSHQEVTLVVLVGLSPT